MIDVPAIKAECNRTFAHALGECVYPACSCLTIPVRHTKPDAEMEDKIRDKASRGDYD